MLHVIAKAACGIAAAGAAASIIPCRPGVVAAKIIVSGTPDQVWGLESSHTSYIEFITGWTIFFVSFF